MYNYAIGILNVDAPRFTTINGSNNDRRLQVRLIKIPIDVVDLPNLKLRTKLMILSDVELRYEIISWPDDFTDETSMPVVNLTSSDALEIYTAFVKVRYPFFSYCNFIEYALTVCREKLQGKICQKDDRRWYQDS